MRTPNGALCGAVLTAATLVNPLIAQDNLVSPWGAPFGVNGTAQAPGFPLLFEAGDETAVSWTLSTVAYGGRPPADWTQIVFDESGNLYWHSPAENVADDQIMSVTPDGDFRWLGPPEGLGEGVTAVSCIVGADAVYVLGMVSPIDEYQYVYALDKGDGTILWEQVLDWEAFSITVSDNQPTPTLLDGVLYVMGVPSNGATVYLLDAATGAYLNRRTDCVIDEMDDDKLFGNTLVVPNAFGPGVHGLYVMGTEAPSTPAVGYAHDLVYAMSVNTNVTQYAVEFEWYAAIDDLTPDVACAHLAYASEVNSLLVYSRGLQTGARVCAFDPAYGDVGKTSGTVSNFAWNNSYWQTGAVDFGADRFFTGGPYGEVISYPIDSVGNVGAATAIETNTIYGHLRPYSQLLQGPDGHTVLVTSTDDDGGGAHVVLVDVDEPYVGPDANGPVYIDDVVVKDGQTQAVVFSEDFEGRSLGVLAGQGAWASTSYDTMLKTPVADLAEVVVDPEDPSNHVLQLLPSGSDHTQSVSHAFAQMTGDEIVVSYRQYVSNRTQYREVVLTDDPAITLMTYPASYGGQNSGLQFAERFEYLYDGGGTFTSEKAWDEVIIEHSFASESSTVYVGDHVREAPWRHPTWGTLNSWAPTTKPNGLSLGGRAHSLTTNPASNTLVAHWLPARDGAAGTHLRGGPLVGPDGKIYVFITDDSDTLLGTASERSGCLVAIGLPRGLCGDANCDGAINAFDIDPFVIALVTPEDWEETYSCDLLDACDINVDGAVNAFDIDPFVIALVSGECPDLQPPTPNPAQFRPDGMPTSGGTMGVAMAAVTGTDEHGPVEYFFDETTGSGYNSGWTTTSFWWIIMLPPGDYSFRVKMRDALGNETEWSEEVAVTISY